MFEMRCLCGTSLMLRSCPLFLILNWTISVEAISASMRGRKKLEETIQSVSEWVWRDSVYYEQEEREKESDREGRREGVWEKKGRLGTASVHCPLSGDYMLMYYFNQAVTWVWKEGGCARECVCVCVCVLWERGEGRDGVCMHTLCLALMHMPDNALHVHEVVNIQVSLIDTIIQLLTIKRNDFTRYM